MRKSKNLGATLGAALRGRADQNARARRYELAFPSPTGSLDAAGNRSLFPGCLPRSGSYSYAPYACRPPTVLLRRVAFLPPRFWSTRSKPPGAYVHGTTTKRSKTDLSLLPALTETLFSPALASRPTQRRDVTVSAWSRPQPDRHSSRRPLRDRAQ